MTGALEVGVAGTVITANRTVSDGVIASFEVNGNQAGFIKSISGVIIAQVLDPRTNGAGIAGTTNKIILTDETGAITDGTKDIGSATQRVKDLYLAGQANVGSIALDNSGSFTPTFTNLTVGNGSVWGYYQVVDGICYFSCGFTMGSTSSVGGNLSMSALPETSLAGTNNYYPTQVTMFDSGAGFYGGIGAVNAANTTTQIFTDYSNVVINATTPFTWATSDTFTMTGSYPI